MKTIPIHWVLLISFYLAVNAAWCQCSSCHYETGELIVNWNFAQGDAGFYSDYNGDPDPGPGLPPLWDPATYQVGNDAGDFHWDFDGLAYSPFPFFGNFMVVNGSDVEGQNIWCQDVAVVPGGEYDFSMWVQSLVTQNPASLQVQINGLDVGTVFDAPPNVNNWQQHTLNWTAPSGVFNATICITNVNTIVGGNDFGLDAISFSGCEPYMIENVAYAGPDTTICSGETVQLGEPATGDIYYTWNPSPYLSDPNISNPSATIANTTGVPEEYEFVLVSDSANLGCISTDTTIVTVLPAPEVNLTSDTAVCSFPITLDAGIAGTSYTWSTSENTQSISVDAPGIYSVVVEVNGCSVSGETEVTLIDFETVDLGGDQVVCTLPITLDATIPGATYEWSTTEETAVIDVPTPGTYTVTVLHNGCESYDEVAVAVDNYLSFDLGENFEVCEFPVELSAPIDDAEYSWSNGDNQNTTSVANPGWTILEIDQDGCTGTDSVLVQLTDFETVDLGPDQTVCELPITLSSNIVAQEYEWSTNENGVSIEIIEPGVYTLTTVQNGCSSSDDIEIFVDSEIPLDLGPDTTVCDLPITLSSPVSGVNYSWSDGSDMDNFTVNLPGIVELTVEQDGCTGTDQIEVFLYEPDDANIPDTLESCLSPVSITTDLQDAQWIWSTGDVSATTETNETGWVYLDYVQNNCPASDSTLVLIDNVLQFEMSESVSTCEFPFTFNSDVQAESYLWSNGDTSQATTVDAPGDYTLTAEIDGCEGSRTINIAAIPHRVVDLPDSLEVCQFPYTFSSGVMDADSYSWSNGNSSEAIELQEAGLYEVNIVDNGCPSSDQMIVVLLPFPSVEIYPQIQTICQDDEAVVSPTVKFSESIIWSHGPTMPEVALSEPGIYAIEAVNNCGSAFGSVEIVVEDCSHYLYIPNAFSPNEDGINDLFEIHAVNFLDTELWIYGRNGQLVFHAADALKDKWNGSIEGSRYYSSPTVLVYQFRGTTIQGKTVEKNGTITVVR